MSNQFTDTAPYYELPLLGFDTETDGIDVKKSHVITCNITYGMLDGTFQANDWLLKATEPIPEGASAVHGISTAYANEHGMDPKEALQHIHDHMYAWESKGLPLVAFNAAFDCSLLTYEWQRYGIESKVRFNRVIDPFVLDKKAFPYRKGNRKLGRLSEIYEVELENAHSADADVMATLMILGKMRHAIPTSKINLGVPLDTLHEWQVQWKHEQAEGLEKYFRTKGGKPDAFVSREWPVILGDTGN